MITEVLRRLCIWRHHGDTSGDKKTGIEGEAFWNYVSYFDKNCAANYWKVGDDPKKKNPACIQKAYKHARVTTDDVELCFRDTGHPKDDVQSTILEPHLAALSEYGVTAAPQIWVQHTTIPHHWSPPTGVGLLQALCKGFVAKGAPDACKKCLGNAKKLSNNDVLKCAKQHYHDNVKHPHRHIWRTLVLLALILVGGGMGYVLWRRRQDGMDLNRDGLFKPLARVHAIDGWRRYWQ